MTRLRRTASGRQISRRSFLKGLGTAAGGLAVAGFRYWNVGSAPLRLILAVPPNGYEHLRTSITRGVELAFQEAGRTAELLGRSIELETITHGPDLVSAVKKRHPAGLIGGLQPDSANDLARMAESGDALFLNVASRSDAYRDASCFQNAFHFEASETMYKNAVAEHEGSGETAVLWHPHLSKYGATQLNDRFRRAYSAGMDSAAWAGWMAVKTIWEASLRSETATAQGFASYLRDPSTRFDGHKGWPLTFNPATGQLRQPLYIANNGKVVAEVPVRKDSEPPNAQLDRLSHGAAGSKCG